MDCYLKSHFQPSLDNNVSVTSNNVTAQSTSDSRNSPIVIVDDVDDTKTAQVKKTYHKKSKRSTKKKSALVKKTPHGKKNKGHDIYDTDDTDEEGDVDTIQEKVQATSHDQTDEEQDDDNKFQVDGIKKEIEQGVDDDTNKSYEKQTDTDDSNSCTIVHVDTKKLPQEKQTDNTNTLKKRAVCSANKDEGTGSCKCCIANMTTNRHLKSNDDLRPNMKHLSYIKQDCGKNSIPVEVITIDSSDTQNENSTSEST